MIKLIMFDVFCLFQAIISVLALTVCGQPQFSSQNFGQPATSLTTPAPVHPAAQVHYVNIGQDLNGDYKVS